MRRALQAQKFARRIARGLFVHHRKLSGLLALNAQPLPIVRTLDFAQMWVMAVAWGEVEATRQALAGLHAFVDPTDADERGIRVRLPDGLAG